MILHIAWCTNLVVVLAHFNSFIRFERLLRSTSPGHAAIPEDKANRSATVRRLEIKTLKSTYPEAAPAFHRMRTKSTIVKDGGITLVSKFGPNWPKYQRPGKALSSSGIKRFRQGDPVRPKPRHSNTTWSRTTSRT